MVKWIAEWPVGKGRFYKMGSKDRQETWAQTNSLLLLGIVDLLEEKGLLDRDGFLERLATFKDESIDIGLFWNTEDELRGDAGYHCGGQQATVRMAERTGLSSGDLVLDAGCGAGGPARHMAEAWGCSVVGLDREYDRLLIATIRTRLMGLLDKVRFKFGDAAEMPFEGNSFDVVWSQGALPFTGDVKRIFQECYRVLRPDGRLAVQDFLFHRPPHRRRRPAPSRFPADRTAKLPGTDPGLPESRGFSPGRIRMGQGNRWPSTAKDIRKKPPGSAIESTVHI